MKIEFPKAPDEVPQETAEVAETLAEEVSPVVELPPSAIVTEEAAEGKVIVNVQFAPPAPEVIPAAEEDDPPHPSFAKRHFG